MRTPIRPWYKDRDFPEIKASCNGEPANILAVVPSVPELHKLIAEHNNVVELLNEAEKALDLVAMYSRISHDRSADYGEVVKPVLKKIKGGEVGKTVSTSKA